MSGSALVLAIGALIVTGEALAADPAGAALTRYDQTAAAISYSGTWGTSKKAAAFKGSYARAAATGASANLVFAGTRLDWIATKGTGAGAADVYLDGGAPQSKPCAAWRVVSPRGRFRRSSG
jgi:hypothetical protein